MYCIPSYLSFHITCWLSLLGDVGGGQFLYKNAAFRKSCIDLEIAALAFPVNITCLKSTIKTLEKAAESVESVQRSMCNVQNIFYA